MPDTVRSRDTVEIILGIGEGPLEGLVNGPKSFYYDTTAIVSVDNKPNFTNFRLTANVGSNMGETIVSQLGGFASSVNVGVNLSKNVPVVRTGVQVNIDALELRFVINQLAYSDDTGTRSTDLQLKVEYKASNSGTWLPAYSADSVPPLAPDNPANGTSQTWIVKDTTTDGLYSFNGDRTVITGGTTPVAPTDRGTAWINNSGRVHFYDQDMGAWAPAGPGFIDDAVEYDFTDPDGKTFRARKSTTPPANARVGDVWFNIGSALIWNGSAWVQGNVAINTVTRGNVTAENGIIRLQDKITSPVVKELRFNVPKLPATTYDIRVTKLSDDATTNRLDSISWESFQEVRSQAFVFPNTATIQFVAQATDQFSSVPTLNSEWFGMRVRVPTNYDPVARTYTGVWDGTFKIAYTNCLPWLVMEAVENTRWGLSRIFPHTCNKWTIYEWAQWCDTMVDDGAGGLRPRVTYNDYVQRKFSVREFINYMAGAGFARMVDDGNGFIDFLIDKPSSPVALFTKENITDDDFSYSYTDRQSRPNDIIVKFKNAENFYRDDARRIVDQADIDTYGAIPTDFEAVGCTNVSEALARARYRLVTGLTEKGVVTFSTNRKGRYLRPWDVILIADPDMGYGMSGRVKEVTGARSVSLRDAITLQAGFTYVATFDIVNPDYPFNSSAPYKTVQRTITSAAGTHTSLAFSADLPALPEKAVFAIEAAGDVGTPKPYRIISITSEDGNPDRINLQCLEHNPSKWEFVDGTVPEIVPPVYSNIFSTYVAPPTNVTYNITTTQEGTQSVRVLNLAWTRSTSRWVTSYRIMHSIDGAPYKQVAETQDSFFELRGLPGGLHEFQIISIDARDRQGAQPAIVIIDTRGEARFVNQPTNLALVGGLTSTTFNSISPTFEWQSGGPDPDFSHYLIRIEAPNDNSLLRSLTTQDLSYTYPIQDARADGGGTATRTIRFKVASVDRFANQSLFTQLTVTNPYPSVPSVSFDATPLAITMKFVEPLDADYAGVEVHKGFVDGFTPSSETKVHDGLGAPSIAAAPGTTAYLAYRFYDVYGADGTPFERATVEVPLIDIGAFTPELEALINGPQEQTDLLAELLIAQQARTSWVREQFQAISYVDGVPVNTVVKEETRQRIEGDAVIVETISLIGAKSSDGLAFILDQDKVKVSPTESLAQRFSTVNASIGSVSAAVTSEATARASADSALSASISSVSTSVAGNTASITSLTSSVNGLVGRAQLEVNVNGHITGWYIQGTGNSGSMVIVANNFAIVDPGNGLSTPRVPFSVSGGVVSMPNVLVDTLAANSVTAGSIQAGAVSADKINVGSLSAISANVGTLTAGTIRNAADSFRVDVTAGRTITKVGGFMKVTGAPFGSSNQFIEWYGPTQADLSTCTEALASYYLKTNGDAYFGGSLSAGILSNKVVGTSLASNAEAEVGPFGSNGNPITVALSYQFSSSSTETGGSSVGGGAKPANTSGSNSAVIDLYRSVAGGAYALVATLNASGVYSRTYTGNNIEWTGDGSSNCGGTLTFTDNTNTTQTRAFKAVIRTFGSQSFGNVSTAVLTSVTTQRISITCVEG